MRAILLAVCLVAGCGGPFTISDAPMSGLVGGVAWSFGSAETVAALSKSDQFWVSAYQEVLATCTGAGDQVRSNRLILNVPKQTGDYLMGTGLNATFYVQSAASNYVATQGRMVVSQITDTMLSGGAHFVYDGNNEVDGQFQAQICPP